MLFRIVAESILRKLATEILVWARRISVTNNDKSEEDVFKLGTRTVNTWNNAHKDRVAALAVAEHRNLLTLYKHIFFTFINELLVNHCNK